MKCLSVPTDLFVLKTITRLFYLTCVSIYTNTCVCPGCFTYVALFPDIILCSHVSLSRFLPIAFSPSGPSALICKMSWYLPDDQIFCENCGTSGHKRGSCPESPCVFCKKSGHIVTNCPVAPPCDICGKKATKQSVVPIEGLLDPQRTGLEANPSISPLLEQLKCWIWNHNPHSLGSTIRVTR